MSMSRMWSFRRCLPSYMIDKRRRNRETRQSDAQEYSYIVTHCMYITELCGCLPSENTEMYFYKLQRHVCTREVARRI